MSTQFGNTDTHQEKGNQKEQKRLKSKYSNNGLISLMVHVGIVFFLLPQTIRFIGLIHIHQLFVQ